MKLHTNKKKHISVLFRGWSGSKPIEFTDRTLIDQVYTKISAIEETRSSSKDLVPAGKGETNPEAPETLRIITAEIRLIDTAEITAQVK
jgi:hypothetical protein